MTPVLNKWSARRSGATITITGHDGETGEYKTITGVTNILRMEDRIVATTVHNQDVELS